MTTRDKLIERAREAIASAHAFDSTFEDYAAAIVDALGLVECEHALSVLIAWIEGEVGAELPLDARAALSKLRGEQS